jgi:hypothetical protein
LKQHEAVIFTLEKLGGQATLGQLYQEVMKVKECVWKAKTPSASIRKIVQVRPEIFKVHPGLWALRSFQKKLGLEEYDEKTEEDKNFEKTHSYFQGLIAEIGNLRKFSTFVPNQDKNKLFINKPLDQVRSLKTLPQFTYQDLVNRSGSIDVIWFNNRKLPDSFFEVEHNTNFQNSLLKFFDLQDFNARMIIVADEHRQPEFEKKLKLNALANLTGRVRFLSYSTLVRQYEDEKFKEIQSFFI